MENPKIAALTIVTSALPDGDIGQSYSANLAATGGTAPYAWSIASGQLMPGLTLNSNGAITGSPMQEGLFSFTAQVTDTLGKRSGRGFSIGSLKITTTTLPNGQVGTAYSAVLQARGGATPYIWSLSSGSLPPGLALASDGTLAGTPTQAGSSSIGFQVTDARGQAVSKPLSLAISTDPPVITTTGLPNGQVGSAYSAPMNASGGTSPYTWSVSSGSLPAGLYYSASGVISGTPTSGGTSSFTCQVKDAAGQTAQKALSILITGVSAPLSITTTSLPNGTVGQAYSAQLNASGGGTPYTWSIVLGSLPSGLSLSSGAISGTPTQSGTSAATFQVKDSTYAQQQTATASLSIQIASVPLQVSTANLPEATVSQAYTAQLNATGGTPPYTWSVSSGSLPAGLSLSSSGAISGTPTTAGSNTFTARVTDANTQTATQSYTLSVTNATSTSCNVYVSPGGSDSNSGTLAAPWQTVQHAFDTVQAGQVVCLRAGTYEPTRADDTSAYRQTWSRSGTAGSPVTIQNYPGEVAIVHGKLAINGSYITFKGSPLGLLNLGLIFEGPIGPNNNDVQIAIGPSGTPHDVILDHIEVRKNDHHAGVYKEGASGVKVLGCWIHDNGGSSVSMDQGMYWHSSSSGARDVIANNLIEHNVSFGIQFYPSGANTDMYENTIINNGNSGITIDGGTGNNIFNNILAGNGHGAGNQQLRITSAGSNNVVTQNILWDASSTYQGYSIGSTSVPTVTGVIIQGPLFVDPANHNYHLQPGSPAIGVAVSPYTMSVDEDSCTLNGQPDLGAFY